MTRDPGFFPAWKKSRTDVRRFFQRGKSRGQMFGGFFGVEKVADRCPEVFPAWKKSRTNVRKFFRVYLLRDGIGRRPTQQDFGTIDRLGLNLKRL
jgi:hypothetical protein